MVLEQDPARPYTPYLYVNAPICKDGRVGRVIPLACSKGKLLNGVSKPAMSPS